MKNYIIKLVAVATVLILGASCEADAELTRLKEVRFAAPVQTSPASITINAANKYSIVETVSWQDVKFPVDAPVTYELQLDVATDTIGATAWAHATHFAVGESVLSKSFLGDDLNQMATAFGLPSDVPGELVVRVAATLDRTIYSEAVVLTITPYTPEVAFGQLYMPGSYEGFDLNNAATLSAVDSGVYQGYLTFPAGQLDFKFVTDLTGAQFYGADANGNFAENGPNNLSAPGAGSYLITVNLNTNTYTLVPYSWGVIGTAQTGGWDTDSDMTYDYQQHYWKWQGSLVSGALKFRLNNSWDVNYGANNNTDGLMFYNNPGAYTVNTAGTYLVTFTIDQSNPPSAPYTVTQL
jgi:hypothetical protein